jgi:hypothetical protein
MTDSELVGMGGELAFRLADFPVVPESGGEREQGSGDPGAGPARGPGAVALEG